MSNILHVCNTFDPAADAVRCVAELKKHSRHKHELLVFNVHPLQDTYQYPLPEHRADNTDRDTVAAMFHWADAVLYQFVGFERGWNILKKPCAFRNINIYWSKIADKFYASQEFNATDLSEYKLLASSHIGAKDFLPGCRWLPDLLDIDDPLYRPCAVHPDPQVGYIKHTELHGLLGDRGVRHVDLSNRPHKYVQEMRQRCTTIVDNVSDGHFGYSGLEGLSLGLPTVVFNHPTTQAALRNLAPEYPPFVEVGPNVEEAADAAVSASTNVALGRASRAWMKKWYHPKRIIERYWDDFFDDLLS